MRARETGAIARLGQGARDDEPPVMIGDELDMTHPAEAARGIYLPVQVYPMFETAIRAAAGTPPDEHLVDDQRAVVALQRRRRRQPVRLDRARRRRRRRSARRHAAATASSGCRTAST